MDSQVENAKDKQLLGLAGLAPLGTDTVLTDTDLVGLIETHNARLARAVERLRRLAAERKRLGDFSAWQQAESVDIATARSHVRRESWDAVLELRRLLEERQAILWQMETRLDRRCDQLSKAHSAAVAATEKRLRKQRREMERQNYATAGGHFADLVAEEPRVAQAAESLVSTRRALDSASAARRAVVDDLSAVTARQRELFALFIG